MSQSAANKMIRLLTGKRLLYTIRILRKSGEEVEIQSNGVPKVDWNSDAREVWLIAKANPKDYDSQYPIMRWADVEAMVVEPNEETKSE